MQKRSEKISGLFLGSSFSFLSSTCSGNPSFSSSKSHLLPAEDEEEEDELDELDELDPSEGFTCGATIVTVAVLDPGFISFPSRSDIPVAASGVAVIVTLPLEPAVTVTDAELFSTQTSLCDNVPLLADMFTLPTHSIPVIVTVNVPFGATEDVLGDKEKVGAANA